MAMTDPFYQEKQMWEKQLREAEDKLANNQHQSQQQIMPQGNSNSAVVTSSWTTTTPPGIYNYIQGGTWVNSDTQPTAVTDTLQDAINACGESFYFLVSPHAGVDSNGKWKAKGTGHVGEGNTPHEAVQDLYNKLQNNEDTE